MKKAMIIYGSTTGNTEEMAGIIKAALGEYDFEVVMKDASHAEVSDMTSEQDLVVLGCPAYGDESVELQEDFQEFLEKWEGIRLDGKNMAVFAPGDSTYEHFCGSVDLLQDKLTALGANIVTEGLKVDGDPGISREEISEWASGLSGDLEN